MNQPHSLELRSSDAPREEWLRAGVLSGFLATFAMSIVLLIAYWLASSIGSASGNALQRWSWALVHNPVAEQTANRVVLAIGANLLMGLVLALLYARVFEPILHGPGWWRGMQFSLLPWLLSLIIFLPLMGGGLFGMDIGAGILPIVGNLVLHLIYGAVLGAAYAVPAHDWLDDTDVDRAHAAAAERGAAVGVVIGLPVGFLLGWWFAPAVMGLAGQPETAIGLAFIGAAIGLAVGSFAGMSRQGPTAAEPLAR